MQHTVDKIHFHVYIIHACLGNSPMPMTGKEMVAYYKKHGWIKKRQTGSHILMYKKGKGSQPIPVHSTKDLGKGLEAKLLKEV